MTDDKEYLAILMKNYGAFYEDFLKFYNDIILTIHRDLTPEFVMAKVKMGQVARHLINMKEILGEESL